MKTAKRDPHEAFVLENATHFTTCVFRGQGRFDVVQHPTLEAARAAALNIESSRPVSIYAIYGVHQGHIENIVPLSMQRRTA